MNSVDTLFKAFLMILGGQTLDNQLSREIKKSLQLVTDASIFSKLMDSDIQQKFKDYLALIKFVGEDYKASNQDQYIYVKQSKWQNLRVNDVIWMQIYCALFQLHLFSNKLTLHQDQHQYQVIFNSSMETFYDHYVNNLNSADDKVLSDDMRVIGEFLLNCSTKNNAFLYKAVQIHMPCNKEWFLKFYSKVIDLVLTLNQSHSTDKKLFYLQQTNKLIKIFINVMSTIDLTECNLMQPMLSMLIEKISIFDELVKTKKIFTCKSKFLVLSEECQFHPLIVIILKMLDNIKVKQDELIDRSHEIYKFFQLEIRQFIANMLSYFEKKQSLVIDFLQMMISQLSFQKVMNDIDKQLFVLNIFASELAKSINYLNLTKNITYVIKLNIMDTLQILYPTLLSLTTGIINNVHKYEIKAIYENKVVEYNLSQEQTKKFEIHNLQNNQSWNISQPLYAFQSQNLSESQNEYINFIDVNYTNTYFPSLVIQCFDDSNWHRLNMINRIKRSQPIQSKPHKARKKSPQPDQKQNQLNSIASQLNSIYQQVEDLEKIDGQIMTLAHQLWIITNEDFISLIKIIQLIINSFLDDQTMTIRLQTIDIISQYHKSASFNQTTEKIFNNTKLVQQLQIRSLDTSKQVRIKVIELLFDILKRGDFDPTLEFYDTLIHRFQDVDSQVRQCMLKLTKKNISILKKIDEIVQRKFFNEILKQIDDSEIIANQAGDLLILFLQDVGGKFKQNLDNKDDQSLRVVQSLIKFMKPYQNLEQHQYQMDKNKVETLLARLSSSKEFNLHDILLSSLKLFIMSSKSLAFSRQSQSDQSQFDESLNIINFTSTCLNVAKLIINNTQTQIQGGEHVADQTGEIIFNHQNQNIKSLQLQMAAFIDSLLEITIFYINFSQDDEFENDQRNHIIRRLFEVLIFILGEDIQQGITFILTQKISANIKQIKAFGARMNYILPIKCQYLQNLLRLGILIELKIFNFTQQVNFQFETSIKLITIKFLAQEQSIGNETDNYAFHYSLLVFYQHFDFIEHFLSKIDSQQFIQDTLIPFYELLLEMTTVSSLSDFSVDILFCIQRIWQKFPSLLFKCQDFLIMNLRSNKFSDPIIIEIYKLFYEKIKEANLAVKTDVIIISNIISQTNIIEQFQIDVQTVVYLIKEIFMVTFKDHIVHQNKTLKLVVLQLLEQMYQNQLTIVLQFGPHLIAALIDRNKQIHNLATRIIHKSLQDNFNHVAMSFDQGLVLAYKLINYEVYIDEESFEGYFTLLDNIVKNTVKGDSKSQSTKQGSSYNHVISEKLIISLRKTFQATNIEHQIFISSQLISLQQQNQNEFKSIMIGILQGFMESFGKLENKIIQIQKQLKDDQNNQEITNGCLSLLARVVYAHVLIFLVYKSHQNVQEAFNYMIEDTTKGQTLQQIMHTLNPQKKTTTLKQNLKQIKIALDLNIFNILQTFNQYIVTSHRKVSGSIESQVVEQADQSGDQTMAEVYCTNILNLCDELYRDLDIFSNLLQCDGMNYLIKKFANLDITTSSTQDDPIIEEVPSKQSKLKSRRGKSSQPISKSTRQNHKRSKSIQSNDSEVLDAVEIKLASQRLRAKKRRARR